MGFYIDCWCNYEKYGITNVKLWNFMKRRENDKISIKIRNILLG